MKLLMLFYLMKKGRISQVSEALYKKNILAVRGSFRPPTHVNMDMVAKGKSQFVEKYKLKENELEVLCEITMNNLKSSANVDGEDFLARVDLLVGMGQKVLVTNYPEYFRLSSYLSSFSRKNIGFVVGSLGLQEIIDEKFYQELHGGIMEAFGVLFRDQVNLYVYPANKDNGLLTSENIDIPKKLKFLYKHLLENGFIEDIKDFDSELLDIYSRKVLEMIQNGESGWEKFVPKSVADTVNSKCLFGHPCDFPKEN